MTTTATLPRSHSTNYADHQGLLTNFARKGWGRMTAAHVDIPFEDVFQEMSVTYVKALRTFNPEHGASFTAYMGRAIWNEFNRFAQKRIDERMNLGMVSIDQLEQNSEESGWFMETTPDSARNPEEELERKQTMLANLRALTPTAKFLAAQLVFPDPELEQAFLDHQADLAATGQRAVTSMTVRFIGKHFKINERRMHLAVRELKTRYGV